MLPDRGQFCTFLNNCGTKGFGSVCTKAGCTFVHNCLLCGKKGHGMFSLTASGWTCKVYKKYQIELLKLQQSWKMWTGKPISEAEIRELFAQIPFALTRVIDELRYAHIAEKYAALLQARALHGKLTETKKKGGKMTKTKQKELDDLPLKIRELEVEVYASDFYSILVHRHAQPSRLEPQEEVVASVEAVAALSIDVPTPLTAPAQSDSPLDGTTSASTAESAESALSPAEMEPSPVASPGYVDSDEEDDDSYPECEYPVDAMNTLLFSMSPENKYSFGKGAGVFMSEMVNVSGGERRPVAVKIFPHIFLGGKDGVVQFKKTIIDELSAVDKIKSNFTVRYIRSMNIEYPVGSKVKYIALVMEREHHLLMDYLAHNHYACRDGDYLNKIKPLIKQLLLAFRDIHAAGIIHRDVKPENILLSVQPSGTACVKVCDFGFCKTKDDSLGGMLCAFLF